MSCKEHYIYNADGSMAIKSLAPIKEHFDGCMNEEPCACKKKQNNMAKDNKDMCTDKTQTQSSIDWNNNNCKRMCTKCTPTDKEKADEDIKIKSCDNNNNINENGSFFSFCIIT